MAENLQWLQLNLHVLADFLVFDISKVFLIFFASVIGFRLQNNKFSIKCYLIKVQKRK